MDIQSFNELQQRTPIFIPMSEIKEFPTPADAKKAKGCVNIKPKGDMLHGFLTEELFGCSTRKEHCGKHEPMDWINRTVLTIPEADVDIKEFESYPKDFVGVMEPQPIDCIALIPDEDGYAFIGGWPTNIVFSGFNSVAISDYPHLDIEISAYNPLSYLFCDKEINISVEDLLPGEFVKRLCQLIKKKEK